MLNISPYNYTDAREAASLHLELLPDAFLAQMGIDVAKAVYEELEWGWVARKDGVLVGVAVAAESALPITPKILWGVFLRIMRKPSLLLSLVPGNHRFPELLFIGTKEPGLGSKMIRNILDYNTPCLWAKVSPLNYQAVAFYLKHGFAFIDEDGKGMLWYKR